MKQKERQLLLKDLYTRLFYGEIQAIEDDEYEPCTITEYDGDDFIDDEGWTHRLGEFKPYLRPMSSMTEEERKEYKHLIAFSGSPDGSANLIDWLNAHHFDYRNLIEKGLALEAPKGMYKEK